MIQPTVGRVVWFWPDGEREDIAWQPYRADICFVHDERKINISGNDHNGHPFEVQEVQLVQEEDIKPSSCYCTWMPYQVGQAKRHAEENKPVDPTQAVSAAPSSTSVGAGDKANVAVDDKVAKLLKT